MWLYQGTDTIIKYKDFTQTYTHPNTLFYRLLFTLENLLTSLCMKFVQEVKFELLPVRVLSVKGRQIVLSVKLAEEFSWSNALWEKLVKIVSWFSAFLVNI